jgi:hypothetical protein
MMDQLLRLHYGDGLTFTQIASRMKPRPRNDVRAGVILAVQDGRLEAIENDNNGVKYHTFRRVRK